MAALNSEKTVGEQCKMCLSGLFKKRGGKERTGTNYECGLGHQMGSIQDGLALHLPELRVHHRDRVTEGLHRQQAAARRGGSRADVPPQL